MKIRDLIKSLRKYYDLDEDLDSLQLVNDELKKIIQIEIKNQVSEVCLFKTFSDLSKEV